MYTKNGILNLTLKNLNQMQKGKLAITNSPFTAVPSLLKDKDSISCKIT
jgi:hypothetical protein